MEVDAAQLGGANLMAFDRQDRWAEPTVERCKFQSHWEGKPWVFLSQTVSDVWSDGLSWKAWSGHFTLYENDNIPFYPINMYDYDLSTYSCKKKWTHSLPTGDFFCRDSRSPFVPKIWLLVSVCSCRSLLCLKLQAFSVGTDKLLSVC